MRADNEQTPCAIPPGCRFLNTRALPHRRVHDPDLARNVVPSRERVDPLKHRLDGRDVASHEQDTGWSCQGVPSFYAHVPLTTLGQEGKRPQLDQRRKSPEANHVAPPAARLGERSADGYLSVQIQRGRNPP